MNKARRFWRGFALALLLAPAIGAAQSGGDPARAAFERGVASMRANQPAEAIPALEESYRLRPLPVVLYNLALAHRAAGRHADALNTFQRYLDASGEVDAERSAAIRTEMASLRQHAGALRIAVEPTDAVIVVDGRAVPRGATTWFVAPGTHQVEVSASGYVPRRWATSARGGDEGELRVTLLRPAVTASVSPSREPTAPSERREAAPRSSGGRGWVLPVVIAGVVAVAAGVTVAVLLATDDGVTPPPTTTGWTVQTVRW